MAHTIGAMKATIPVTFGEVTTRIDSDGTPWVKLVTYDITLEQEGDKVRLTLPPELQGSVALPLDTFSDRILKAIS